jgi:hypothetical protein
MLPLSPLIITYIVAILGSRRIAYDVNDAITKATVTITDTDNDDTNTDSDAVNDINDDDDKDESDAELVQQHLIAFFFFPILGLSSPLTSNDNHACTCINSMYVEYITNCCCMVRCDI